MRKFQIDRVTEKGNVGDQQNVHLLVSISLVTLIILARNDFNKTKAEEV